MADPIWKAVFNAAGSEGLSKLEPGTDGDLAFAEVHTVAGREVGRAQEYQFPQLDGAGSIFFGLEPNDLAWLLTFTTTTAAKRISFEAKIRAYKGAGRFTLKSETGDEWDNVELRGYEHVRPVSKLGSGSWKVEARVIFRQMQPGAVSAR